MERPAGVGEGVDALIQPVEPGLKDLKEFITWLEFGHRAGRARQQEAQIFGRETCFEQAPDLAHDLDGVVGVVAVAVGAADRAE